MVCQFLLFYYFSGLFFSFSYEGCFYMMSMISCSVSVDTYSVYFYYLLGMVSGCVGVWSYYYMKHEESYSRFILLLISFLMSMVMLIFFSNMYMTLIGWDCLGITSFLLVIYYKNRKSLGSGIITSLTNRLGDCFLICILGFLYERDSHAGIMVMLVLLSMTKSAQFPFSSWLPAAMAAPTPVSALVHSSTLVTAGVYVLIRYCCIESNALLSVGCITMIMAGLSACAESDIKKVVALSTLSQLGVMMVSLGAGEKSYCFFHLTSHACFKALLFMSIGFSIHSVYGTQDYRSFNSIKDSTANSLLCAVANLSLMGFIFSSGFYSKDMILESLYYTEGGSWSLILFLLGVGLTASYSMKMFYTLLLCGSFTGTPTSNLSGMGWESKFVMYLLGFFSVFYGATFEFFCSPIVISYTSLEKMLPICLLILGITVGITFHRLNSHPLSSLFLLTPATQGMASQPLTIQHQTHVDKGWLEATTVGFSALSTSIVYHYSPAVGVGLSSLLLILMVI